MAETKFMVGMTWYVKASEAKKEEMGVEFAIPSATPKVDSGSGLSLLHLLGLFRR